MAYLSFLACATLYCVLAIFRTFFCLTWHAPNASDNIDWNPFTAYHHSVQRMKNGLKKKTVPTERLACATNKSSAIILCIELINAENRIVAFMQNRCAYSPGKSVQSLFPFAPLTAAEFTLWFRFPIFFLFRSCFALCSASTTAAKTGLDRVCWANGLKWCTRVTASRIECSNKTEVLEWLFACEMHIQQLMPALHSAHLLIWRAHRNFGSAYTHCCAILFGQCTMEWRRHTTTTRPSPGQIACCTHCTYASNANYVHSLPERRCEIWTSSKPMDYSVWRVLDVYGVCGAMRRTDEMSATKMCVAKCDSNS